MTEKICKHCKFLLTVTTTTGNVWYECILAYSECADVELNETCTRWQKAPEETKGGLNNERPYDEI